MTLERIFSHVPYPLRSNISMSIFNDILTLNRWKKDNISWYTHIKHLMYICCITMIQLSTIRIHIHTETKSTIMTTSMNERTHFFRKIYLSHFILERVAKGLMLVMCERWVGDGTDCNILTPSSSDYSSTSSSFCCILSPTGTATRTELTRTNFRLELNQAVYGTWLYKFFDVHLLPMGVRICTEFNHVHRSRWYSNIFDRMHLFLDWRLGRGSICYNHPVLIFQNFTCGIFLHVRLHPPHTHILQIQLRDNNSRKKCKKKLLESQQK